MIRVRTLTLVLISLLAQGICAAQSEENMKPTSVSIESADSGPVIAFGKGEFTRFLTQTGDARVQSSKKASWRFVLRVDPSLAPYAFAVTTKSNGDAHEVELTGHDATCVLHAVYTALEHAGYRFEITGPIAPEHVNLAALDGLHETIHPAVLERGVRQHINFPMDISSYPLEEAKAYIDNLSRLRFNHITFHSYPGQWVEYGLDTENPTYAGAFFYGQRHDIPDVPLLKKVIRNKHTFCIPSIEPVFYDRPERSHRAVAWLREVMAEAKRVGLTVQLSVEPRAGNLQDTLALCNGALTCYPQIDVLELITEETGGWGNPTSPESIADAVRAAFGDTAVDTPAMQKAIAFRNEDFSNLVAEITNNINAINALKTRFAEGAYPGADKRPAPRLVLGVYCVVPDYLQAIIPILRERRPEGVDLALLPGHGSTHVAQRIAELNLTKDDWDHLMLYSWIEFDGLMYLQQNGAPGIHDVLQKATQTLKGAPIHAMCFNHWRTAENRVTARYAAESTLAGPVRLKTFYNTYAAGLGIAPTSAFATAMDVLGQADEQATDGLGNIGFSYVGCWWPGSGLGYYGSYKDDMLKATHTLYDAIHDELAVCAARTDRASGQTCLAFLDNRVCCTMIHLQAVREAVKLQPLCANKKPEDLSEADRAQVAKICDKAIAMMDDYMALHAEAMPDRGCEGTLISYYYTPPAVLKKIRALYAGGEAPTSPGTKEGDDAPPSPIMFEK